MSISLEKRAEKIGIILAKNNIVKVPPVRVGLALDVSGSTSGLYNSGIMQETVDRLLAVSLKFDDNGELDMWAFDDEHTQLETATPNDYHTYLENKLLNESNVSLWGGTNYAGALKSMVDFWFGAPKVEKKSGGWLKNIFSSHDDATTPDAATEALHKLPAMGLLVTDGEASDKHEAENVLRDSQKYNVYWQMVGVGPAHHFEFLQRMADKYPNVGFVNLTSLDQTDDEIYSQLIAEEFIGWLKKISA
jgi:hypothetical protein